MSTEEIFQSEGKKLVIAALEGFNVTIFTYGQTASGKTYTMRGGENVHPGIIPLSLKEVFHELYTHHGLPYKPHSSNSGSAQSIHHASYSRESFINKQAKLKTWIVKVSYIEIYNECVNDLLDPMRKNLSVRENQ